MFYYYMSWQLYYSNSYIFCLYMGLIVFCKYTWLEWLTISFVDQTIVKSQHNDPNRYLLLVEKTGTIYIPLVVRLRWMTYLKCADHLKITTMSSLAMVSFNHLDRGISDQNPVACYIIRTGFTRPQRQPPPKTTTPQR